MTSLLDKKSVDPNRSSPDPNQTDPKCTLLETWPNPNLSQPYPNGM